MPNLRIRVVFADFSFDCSNDDLQSMAGRDIFDFSYSNSRNRPWRGRVAVISRCALGDS